MQIQYNSVMEEAIKVQDISKKFVIGHETREKHTALTDVISAKTKKIFSFPFRMRSNKTVFTSEEFWALKGISFSVKRGDRIGVIGRNGAGKSTLLKILSRITEPTAGRVSIHGRVASLLEVGTGFHPELTGRENVFLNGAILGMSRAEIRSKFDEIVSFAEVEKFLDTPVKRYSSGMYVRLAFAVAAHLEPDILIVDEVLAVGDAQFQKKCLGKIEEVSSNEGRTVLFVSHQMPTILNLCNSCIYLESGSIKEIGDTAKVIASYMNKDSTMKTEFDLSAHPAIAKKAAPYFRLEKFYLKSSIPGSLVIEAEQNEVLELVIEGEVEESDIRFNLGFSLTNEFGEVVLMSYSTDQPENNWLKLPPGKHSISTFIDTSILNEGKYFIHLLGSLHCVKMLYTTEDNISIGFEIVGNRGNSPYWINKRNSILAPFINWKKTNKVVL